VLGANPLLAVIDGYVHRIWQGQDIDKVLMVRKGVFLVRFNNMDDRMTVLKKGWYFFDRKPFIVKAWNKDLSLDTSNLHSIPIWVRFPTLDIKFWGINSLSKLGSMLGIPIKTDKATKDKSALAFARLLIEMPFEGPFPEHIDFVSDGDRVIRQAVQYEWKPTWCTFCKLLGHEAEHCRKKEQGRKEWRVKAKPATTQIHSSSSSSSAHTEQPIPEEQRSEEQGLEGFVAPCKFSPRATNPSRSPEPLTNNTFEVLNQPEMENIRQHGAFTPAPHG